MINAAIDIETTGLIAGTHEVIQFAVIPYDVSYNPISRFVSYIRPFRPEYAAPEAMKVNGLDLEGLASSPTPVQVRACFLEWKEGLFGSEQICPLGHNYAHFDSQFLKLFFTPQMYNNLFSHRVKDTCIVARYLIDKKSITEEHGSLTGLLKYFNIERKQEHDAYEDALSTIKLYQRMLSV